MPSQEFKHLSKLLSEGWISLNRLRSLLGVSYPTITNLVKQGRIITVKIGGVNRVYASEIERILREGTTKIVCEPIKTERSIK